MSFSKQTCQFSLKPNMHDGLKLVLLGDWIMSNDVPSLAQFEQALTQFSKPQRVIICCSELGLWDSRLLVFIIKLERSLKAQNIQLDPSGLPKGVQGLLHLAAAVPEQEGARRTVEKQSLLSQLGKRSALAVQEAQDILAFTGEASLSLARFALGKARFRGKDFWLIVEQCGPQALPIVTLISILIGLILAFVGAIQLRLFGADIYIANLVALGMVREMGAMMTAIIMAGRTGAAYAAQLGTMQVNEEIDAFKTMGFVPMDFLVLPRLLALIVMLPLLTLYADFLGVLGGLIVGVGMLDLSLTEYYTQTVASITLLDCATGLIKSSIFGVLVALSGCMRGMQCGRSSSAVGDAATSAVVSGIVSVVVADSVLTVVYDSLNI